MPLTVPPHLLLCGAGADTVPLAHLAVGLGLAVTVCDHRPALATAGRFPLSEVRCVPAAEFAAVVQSLPVDAAIVMSHHLPADLEYLRALAVRPDIAYVGLLGPAARLKFRRTFERVDGGTRFAVSYEGEPRGFLKLAWPLITRMAKRQQGGDMRNLKELMEAHAL